jgi:hypothetical protein
MANETDDTRAKGMDWETRDACRSPAFLGLEGLNLA